MYAHAGFMLRNSEKEFDYYLVEGNPISSQHIQIMTPDRKCIERVKSANTETGLLIQVSWEEYHPAIKLDSGGMRVRRLVETVLPPQDFDIVDRKTGTALGSYRHSLIQRVTK